MCIPNSSHQSMKYPFLLFLTAVSCWWRKSAAWTSSVSRSTDIHTDSEEGASQLPGGIWILICCIQFLHDLVSKTYNDRRCVTITSLQFPCAQAREGRGIALSLHSKQITPHKHSGPGLLCNTVQLRTSLKKNVQHYLTVTNTPCPVPYHCQLALAHNRERQQNRIRPFLITR